MARHQAVTFAVLAGGDRRVTRAFLGELGREAIDGDNVVVLHHPDDDGTWRTWQRQAGFKPADPGASPQKLREVVVVLDDHIEPSHGFVEQLCEAFGALHVGAVAARSNLASGDELLVGVPYRPYEPGVRHSFLHRRASEEGGHFTPASVLDSGCFALCRSALAGRPLAALWDPAGLSRQLVDSGWMLGIAEGAYAHHPGGFTARSDKGSIEVPLISACLIVRDEHDDLLRCLESCRGIVDEVVVYDTGSIDDTRDIAAAAGAKVIEGYWDDDFARARNDALEHCRGQWILWLDADEALAVSPGVDLRARLAAAPTAVEGYLVLIDNLQGTLTSNMLSHPACRLFRRACGRWDGRIHEQIVARAGTIDLALELTDAARITHWGYLQSAVAKRDKGERNLRTAFGDLAGGSGLERAARLASLGRSYLFARRLTEGIDLCKMAADMAQRPSTRHIALRGAIEGLLIAEDPEGALVEIARLRACSEVDTLSDVLEGQALLALERYGEALAVLERVGPAVDEDGFEYQPELVAGHKAEALVGLERFDDAANLLLSVMREGGGIDVHIGVLIDALEHAGRDLAELASAIGPARLRTFLPPLLQLQADAAHRTLDAWYQVFGPDTALLAAASQVAHRLPIESQLVWSARLRQHDLGQACPLVAATSDLALSTRDRIIAAAVALTAFHDPRAEQAFVANVLATAGDERAAVREQLGALNASLIGAFDALEAPETPSLPASPARDGRAVLVIDRHVSGARALGLAATAALVGHDVTLLTPQPAAGAEALLAPYGVAVHGWREDPDAPDSWIDHCLRLVAYLSAERHYDAVVLRASAEEACQRLRTALPLTSIVLDLEERAERGERPRADLFLTGSATHEGDAVMVPTLDISASGYLAPVPLSMRRGVLVVGATRDRDPLASGDLDRLAEVLAASSLPVALLGDDPTDRLAGRFRGAISVGPLPGPGAWMAASRVVVVLDGPANASWLDGAARVATPAVVLGPSGDGPAAVERVRELATVDAAWFTASLTSPISDKAIGATDFLGEIPARHAARYAVPKGDIEVRFVGAIDSLDSLAQVNRSLASELAAGGHPFNVSVLARDVPTAAPYHAAGVQVSRDPERLPPATLEIRHLWPPDFTPSATSRLVLIQPWEFGGLPAEWVGPLRDVVDELWVPTTWVREGAIASGLDPVRVAVVPNGVDVERYRPDGPRLALSTSKSIKLLFVGGLIERKGVDALLEAYLSAFDADDDVCLVIKAYGSASVYRNATLEPAVRRAAEGSGAQIEFVDGDRSAAEMAALYRACDVLVHPYRGEGFGLPIAEAMASGLPVIVPDGGACRDFVDEQNGWLVKTERVAITPAEWTPTKAGAWWLEASRTSLVAALRAAVGDQAARREKGWAGRERIVSQFTWTAAAEVAAKRIIGLTCSPVARRGGCG